MENKRMNFGLSPSRSLPFSHPLFVCAFFSGRECKCALRTRVCVCGLFSCRVNNFNPFVQPPAPPFPLAVCGQAIYKNKLN